MMISNPILCLRWSSDIIKGLVRTDSPTISGFIKGLPHDLLDELENNEQQAGQFICDILDGDVPAVIENLASDVWSEIEGDWSVVTDFIVSLPTLAPEVLEEIVQDGEGVVSVIGEIFTNPGAAITVIESGVEEVVSDITSVGGDVISFVKCLFGDCSTPSSPPNAAATLSASCQAIMAAATTTYTPTEPAATTTYPAAQTSHSSSAAAATTTTVQATPKTSTEIEATSTTSAAPAGAQGSSGSLNCRAFAWQIWLAMLICFLFVVIVL
jgi:hypothetical protein